MVSIKMTQGAHRHATLSLPDRLAGIATFAAAVLLLRCLPFRATLATARTLKRLARRSASQTDVERALTARDWAIRWFPGRAACLENSLAAFLFAVLHGRAVHWCIGCRFPPAESHAWIQSDTGPVGEPDLPDRPFRITVQI